MWKINSPLLVLLLGEIFLRICEQNKLNKQDNTEFEEKPKLLNFGWYEWTAIVLLPIYLYGSLQSLWNFVHIASSGQTILVVTARQSRRNRSWIELRMLYVLYVLNWINVRVWLGRTKSVLEKFYLLIICGWEKNFNSWAMNFQLPLLDIAEFEDCVMLFGLPTNKFWSSFWCKECRLLPLNSLEEQDTQC